MLSYAACKSCVVFQPASFALQVADGAVLASKGWCEGALAGQIPAYKVDMVLRQLTDTRHHNDTLAQQLEVMSERLLAAEQAKDESDIKLQHTEMSQVSRILSRHTRFCMHWLIVCR